jgi:hypothetical protein
MTAAVMRDWIGRGRALLQAPAESYELHPVCLPHR